MTEQPRTIKQNNSQHKWFQEIADYCTESGIQLDQLYGTGLEIPVTKESVHGLFNGLALSMFGVTSSGLTTKQHTEVTDAVIKNIGQNAGIDIQFPSMEKIFEEQRLNEQ